MGTYVDILVEILHGKQKRSHCVLNISVPI